jgi:hypothetical protein
MTMRVLHTAMVITACMFVQPAFSADRWIAPSAVGKKDGTSPSNAASPSSLDSMVRSAGPGGRVFFITDRGSYKGSGYRIWSGGQSGKPVTISGATSSGKSARAMVYGTGERFVSLYSGANYVTISNFNFESFGQGVIYIGAKLKGVNIENVDASKIRKFVDMPDTAGLDGFTFKNLTSKKFSKAFIQLRHAVNGLITDVNIDSARTDGDPLPFGVHADGKTGNVTIRNMTVKNILYSYNADPNRYWNGDGVATERETYGIRIENVRVEGSSDAAFDLKGGTSSKPHLVINSSGYNVKRGLRVWGYTQADNVRINGLKMPWTTKYGKTITQSYKPGGTAAVWMKAGSTLRYRNIYLDNVKIAPPTFDQRDGKSYANPY